MDIGLIVSFAGVVVAALAGVLGVWMERDPGSPKTWGLVFSGLIVVASGVELSNTASSTAEAAETDAKLATVLEAMSELAAKGDNPALEQFVGAELAVQARANPEVVKKMEKSIAAKGGDPEAVKAKAAAGRRMAAGLPADKPKAGERPRLAGPRAASARTTGPGKARRDGARAPGLKGAKAVADGFGAKAGKAGKAASAGVGRAKAVGAQADEAAARVQAAGGRAGAAAGAARARAGAAAAKVDAAASDAAEATEAAAARVTAAADTAKQAEDDAKKKADEARKKAEEEKKKAKNKAKDKAKDAAKSIGF